MAEFPFYSCFERTLDLPDFRKKMVDLNALRQKNRFPNPSTKFRLFRKEYLKAVTRRINFCGSKKATILKMSRYYLLLLYARTTHPPPDFAMAR